MKLFAYSALALVVLGCGSARPETGDSGVYHLHYITFGPGVTGLVSKVKKPQITACLTGVGGGQVAEWDDKISRAILKWVDVLRPMTSAKLASSVLVSTSGGDCDTNVVIQPGTHANTSIGQRPTVRMDHSGYFASFNVLLHEFGHGFALSDTYQGGQSGNCQPGQPQAVMCNTSFDTPQKDDIAGLAEIFKNEFPTDEPGSVEPPPATALDHQLFVALGLGAADGSHPLKVGLSGAAEVAGAKLEICRGSKVECMSSGSWTPATREGVKGDAVLFGAGTLAPTNGMNLTIRYSTAGAAAYRTISFAQPT